MSPPAGTGAQLRQLVHYHLDTGFPDSALFFASRLYALEPRNADACHLLALANLRLGQHKAAFDYAKPKGLQAQHLGCAYVFAQACLSLGRYALGAEALQKARGLWTGRFHWNRHSETSRRHIADAPACACLLGKLYEAYGDSQKAMQYYQEALKINPFMWDAYVGLCNMGAVVRPSNIFKITPDVMAAMSHPGANANDPRQPVPQNSLDEKDRNPFVSTPDIDPFNPSFRPSGDVGLNHGGSNLLSKLNGSMPMTNGNPGVATYPDLETPTSNGQNIHHEDVMMGETGGPVMNEPEMGIPHAPGRKTRMQNFGATEEPPKMRPITSRTRNKMATESNEQTDIPRPVLQNGHKRTISGHSTQHSQTSNQPAVDPTAAPPRRSVRLLNSISQMRPSSSRLAAQQAGRELDTRERRDARKVKATGTKGKTSSGSTMGRVVSGNRKATVEHSESSKPDSRQGSVVASGQAPQTKNPPPVDSAREQEAVVWLLELLYKIGSGYKHLSNFECKQAIEMFFTVPIAQRESPWLLAQLGKAYYELSRYSDAQTCFQRLREKAPSYMDDMEVFSNTLWQLKKDTDLAYLAHTLFEQDRYSPQALCAIGNSFSLQRRHDDAIQSFTRATQVDPKFAYAFTLQGHEHVANEEYDKAMHAYRCAIDADPRHYNGWYGLGTVFEKLGKYDMAEKHYRFALDINPSNALLKVKIGIVLERVGKLQPALDTFEEAVRLDPGSQVARFRRAQLHLRLGNPEEAFKDLKLLKDVAPEDASTHFYLGRTYKKLGDKANAIRHLTIALNLDPRAQAIVKETMESLDDEDGGDWSSDDNR